MRNSLKRTTWPAALAGFSLLLGWYFSGGTDVDFKAPLLYQGDGVLILALIKRVMENHWVYSTWLMGAPFGSSIFDYPIPDSGSLLALKIFGVVFGSAPAAYNAYFLTGFALNAVAGYAVLRQLLISRPLSFAGSLIFTFLPFHFIRLGHLFYTWYFAAPLFTWFALRAYRGSLDLFRGRSARSQIADAAVLLALTCFGVYYAFFGVIAVLTAALARYLAHRTLGSVRGPLVAAAIVFGGVVLNVAPTIAYAHVYGQNTEAAARNPAESETYGMKIDQLLLPRIGHRIPVLARVNARYAERFPLVNENATATLGIIGSIGFLVLLVMVLAPKVREDDRLVFLSLLTISFVIFCTIGGMSAMFAMIVSPMIRAWNRASVFVGFFSIAAALLLVQYALNRFTVATTRVVTPAVAVVLCVVGLFDQTTPPCVTCSAGEAQAYASDAAFVASVEQTVPSASMIYQLPYMAFPEMPPVNRLGSYDEAVGFLHSKTLRWSFGGMKARQGDLFYRALAQRPIDQQIATVRKMGFSGVWVERRAYLDDGKDIAESISKTLGHGPTLTRPNQFFFALK